MAFSQQEREQLLALKGVGETVIKRLEEAGYHSLASLRGEHVESITLQISQMLRASCWHNSPQARSAIKAVVELANAD